MELRIVLVAIVAAVFLARLAFVLYSRPGKQKN
jgi:hypothetical protein